ncbi:hypothetical protein CI793_12320 [Anoxybacillus ayderensis]|uniref:hypothetical protein n=1 Tax=Anoxybacillus sp. ST70 TaxID=2864180 RepID=UPI0002EDB8FC|nr:hypothetical protein [Anoxybacillus sp. ST70]MBW9219802.1 hypothetical protein [Anoxybacillus sp. ST70]THD15556.1 hypothetical protein CI793_12320 [Anoxybacillus ayderensis]
MSDILDQLEVIDGYFDDNVFYMRGIGGYAIEGRYKAKGLRSLARLIDENEPFSFIVDKETIVHVPVELNKRIKQELNMIADELDTI